MKSIDQKLEELNQQMAAVNAKAKYAFESCSKETDPDKVADWFEMYKLQRKKEQILLEQRTVLMAQLTGVHTLLLA